MPPLRGRPSARRDDGRERATGPWPALEVLLLSRPTPLHFGAVIADWTAAGWDGPASVTLDLVERRTLPGHPVALVALVVPANLDPVHGEDVAHRLRGGRAAVVGYGGAERGARAVRALTRALHAEEVRVSEFSLALNAGRLRVGGFSAFDHLARGLLLASLLTS